jgi:fructose-1,6-bisphosphatase II
MNHPFQHISQRFIRVTQSAALAASHWFGRGDKNAADGAAVTAMREAFNTIPFTGTVVIGEGEKDEAPMLYHGEQLGIGGPLIDIAVDPLECTSNLAKGKTNSISVLAAGNKGTLRSFPGTYVDHIAVGQQAKGVIDLDNSVKENIKDVANALNKRASELHIVVLDRDRHKKLISDIRKTGARVSMPEHGTIVAGIAPAIANSPFDMLMGTGGAPEAVIIAAALRALGGDIQVQLKPHNEKTKQDAVMMGYTDFDKVYAIKELAAGDDLTFVATGISTGPFIKGIVKYATGAQTSTLLINTCTGLQYIKDNHPKQHLQSKAQSTNTQVII